MITRKFSARCITVVSAGILFVISTNCSALTLEEYYSAAVKRSESTAIALEQIKQVEEKQAQANAALFPTINGIAAYSRHDPVSSGSPQTPSTLDQQNTSRITLSQPIYRGMREFAAIRQSRDLLGAQKQDYRQAEILLYKDVLTNFYSILMLESDIVNYQEAIRLNKEREKDMRQRVHIGRSRNSELLNVLSNINTLQATVAQLQGQLAVAREGFVFLSGLDATTPLKDTSVLPSQLASLQDFLSGIKNRPDVLAAQQRSIAAHEAVSIARGEHQPSLDLNANYYFERPGYLDESKWDMELAITVPIFAGGGTQSKVREANAQRNQADLTQSQVFRQAEQEIRSLYQSVVSSMDQINALKLATDASKKSYQAQLNDYKLGLVTNLDVNQALATFQENKRVLDHTILNSFNELLQLQTASAHYPAMVVRP